MTTTILKPKLQYRAPVVRKSMVALQTVTAAPPVSGYNYPPTNGN